MTADLTPEVAERLKSDHYGWLTTVAKSGQPVPRLIWFYFDGAALYVYTKPGAAKVAHIERHSRVSLNLDSDGQGGGVIVIGGEAAIDGEGADCRQDGPYWAKYGPAADQFGLTDSMGDYSTRLRIGVDRVWTTPAS